MACYALVAFRIVTIMGVLLVTALIIGQGHVGELSLSSGGEGLAAT